MTGWDLPDGPVTIMFTDVEGSTALATRLGDAATRPLMRRTEETVRAQLEAHGGHEVKAMGDGHMVWFASARRAVTCAVAIQRALLDAEVRVRIGLSTGEVTQEAGDLFGEAVNLAARVAARAEGGEVLVAEVVRQLTGTVPDVTYREKGRFKLKGFPERMRLFAVEWDAPAPIERAPAALPLVGRTAELDVVRAVLDRTSGGRGGVVLIEGEAGIGKTRLASEAVTAAERRGATVLRGVAADLDRTQPFRAIADSLGAVRGSQDPRRREIAELLQSGAQDASGYRIEQACLELLEELALAGPVLLVVEDLHWADPSTLQVLRSLLPSTTDLPLAVIGTLRPSPRTPELQGVIDRVVAAGNHHVHLAPLGVDEQLALASEAGGATPDAALAARLAATGGNPLYVIEVVRAAQGDGKDVTPDSLRSTILAGLVHLPTETLEALRLAAVLGSAFNLTDLATAADKSAVSLVPVLREALAAQVIVETAAGLAFRHDLIRESLYEDLPATVRKALHAEIGRSLAAAGANAGLVAVHLAQGVEPGDLDAVTWIARAAREATTRSITAGIELLEQAMALCGPLRQMHDELEAELVLALAWAGESQDAIVRAKAALARHPGRDAGFALRAALGEAYITNGEPEPARVIGQESLELGAEGADRARFMILAHYMLPTPETAAAAEQARALAEEAGDDTVVGLSHLIEAYPSSFARDFVGLEHHLHAALAAFDRAATPSSARYRLQVLGWLAWQLEAVDRPEEGALVRRQARMQAEELGAVSVRSTFDSDDAFNLYQAGRVRDARSIFEALVAEREERGHPLGEAAAWVAIIAILTGDPDAARLVERIADDPVAWPMVAALEARERGDHQLVVDSLLGMFRFMKERGWGWPMELASPPLLRSALAAGRRAEVEVVVADAEAAAAIPEAPDGTRAMALWFRGLADRDAALLREALDVPAAAERPLERAFCQEDLGLVLAEQGDKAGARAALEEALATFEALDLPPSVTRVSASLRELGVRKGAKGPRKRPTSGWESVTPSEHKVIELVAQGMTNPQIAKQLYVSRHTVDSHLKHVYVKLGLSSRVELAGVVARRG